MPYTNGMDIALNWDDLADELKHKWTAYAYPINFGETSGLVEYDEWFANSDGEGSIIQFIIDACAEAKATPFFLTKIRYPDYLPLLRQSSGRNISYARTGATVGRAQRLAGCRAALKPRASGFTWRTRSRNPDDRNLAATETLP